MKKKILVVDDDPTSLRVTQSVLTAGGYEVIASYQAEDIVAKAGTFQPDLIVMDWIMPKVDGAQAVAALQNNQELKDIPVLFLTGISTHNDEQNTDFEITVGAKSYRTLSKPVEPKSFLGEVRNLLGSA